ADFNRAIELEPDSLDAYWQRSWSYESLKDYDHAIADATRVIELDKDKKPDNYLSRGIFYSLKGEDAAAAADFLQWATGIQTESIDSGALTIGQPANITMSKGSVFRFQFEAKAGQHLRLSAVSDLPSRDVDTLIIVLGPDGPPLTGKDDVAVNQD